MKMSVQLFARISAVCLPALIAGSTVYCQEKGRLTFDQIFKGAEPRLTTPLPTVSGWADDGHYVLERRATGATSEHAVDARTGKEAPYRDMQKFQSALGEGVNANSPASADESYTKLIYMKGNDLFFLDAETGKLRQLTSDGAAKYNPTVAPGGKFVAFTRGGDLFTIDLATGEEHRWTADGGGAIQNGHAAWLYFEEILGRESKYKAFWWSPDGRFLSFYRFDETLVPVFPLFNARGTHGSLENTRYPLPGDPNPAVRIGIIDLSSRSIAWADFDEKVDQYFGTPFWSPRSDALWVQWMNRAQDTLLIYAVDAQSGSKKVVYEDHQPTWVYWIEDFRFLGRGSKFLFTSDRDGWTHIYLYDTAGKLHKCLTVGAWAVDKVVAVSENEGWVYFTAKKEITTRTDLYRVKLDGTGLTRLTFGDFTHQVKVSPGGKYFVTTYSNVRTPGRMALYDGSGKIVREIADSKTDNFEKYRLGATELFRIMTTDSFSLPAIWTLPRDFDPHKKYPVLISVYGGPGSESVSDGWKGIADQWLSEEGLIQMSVDHRGSGHFGIAGTSLMYRNLGKWEMHDYIETVKWLRAKPFIDSTRICITGGSYGGYVTCLALTEAADYFTHGLALFSVTDWHLYDSHYVERYMNLPSENPDGYARGSVLTYVGNYKGLLGIVHGTMDDNVHMQNSLQLIDTLESLQKHFEAMFYPGERHGWRGPKAVELRNESYRFYYRYLLAREFPEALFEGVGVRPRRER